MQNPNGSDMNTLGLMNLVVKYKKSFFMIAIAAAILSYIFSSPFFITPLYKSTVILYPTSTNSISKILLSSNFNTNKDMLEFGEDEQTERMLQVLNSNKIRDRVIEKFDLMKHYSIPTGSDYRLTKLNNLYESNIKFRRTEYMAVKITVLDKDPYTASLIANNIAELFDSTMNFMQKEVAIRGFQIVENEYFKLRDEVKFMEDSLNSIRRLGINDYESQSEMFNQQLALELAKGNKLAIKALEDKLELLAKYGGNYVSLRDMLEHERKQLSQIKAKYEEAKVDATQNLPHKFVVSAAVPAERKSFPIRWLIMVVAVFSTLFLTIIVLIIIDQFIPIQPTKKTVKRHYINYLRKRTPAIKPTRIKVKSNNQHTWNIMDNYFNNTSLVRLIMRWKLHLAAITIIAAVLGAVFSGSAFITPLYKSEAIAYPANINSYSDESETEQMLQLLQSQDIIDSMTRIFDLLKHYEIDPNYQFMQTALLTEFKEKVKIRKTPYEAISITVKDENPETASKMAAEMLRLYDEKVGALHKKKYQEVINMYDTQLFLKRKQIDSLQARMFVLGNEYGLIDYTSQSQEIMRGYLRTVYGSNTNNINSRGVDELKQNIENHGGELLTITTMLQHESHTFVETKLEREQALRFYEASLTYSNIISQPFPSDKKAFPVRWVIVAFSAIGAFLLSLLVIFVLENKRSFNDETA